MSKVDDGASDAEAIERQELSRVVVSFSGITDPAAIGLRIEDSADIFPLRLDQDEGSWVKVEERPVAVEVAGASAAGLQIGVGMQPISVAWAGQKKTISTAADWHAAVDAVFASKGAAVDFAVTFQRSSPPMLMPGWARKALRKKQNTRFTSEQRDFLNLMFSQGGGKGERMRPKKVVRLMRENNFPFAGASRHWQIAGVIADAGGIILLTPSEQAQEIGVGIPHEGGRRRR
jgi:hypothetical protein